MRLRIGHRVLPLWRDNAGGVAAEFAVGVPVFLLAISGLIDLGLGLFVGAMLESSVIEASRYGATGTVTAGMTREEGIRDVISRRTLGVIDMDSLTIDQRVYASFSVIGAAEPYDDVNANGAFDVGETYTDQNSNGSWDQDVGTLGVGGSGEIVFYRVEYDWPVLTPLMRPIASYFKQRAVIAVRNEPF